MYAIASLVDPVAEQQIRALWQRFAVSCGLPAMAMMAIPHFSWVTADYYHLSAVNDLLSKVAGEMPKMVVHSAGLGIFTGPLPVVYISLVKDQELIRWHDVLWEKARPYAVVPNLHYHPASWMPHITLSQHESDSRKLACGVQDLLHEKLDLELSIDNLALIFHTENQAGVYKQYKMKRENENG